MRCGDFKFRLHKQYENQRRIPYTLPPLRTLATPEELCKLCEYLMTLDEIPLPAPLEWTKIDVLKWIENLGFKHYRNTFNENMVDGKKLLLLDVSALCKMNIKPMADILKIRDAIEELFGVEKESFARSITLQDQEPHTKFKYYKTSTGPKYELMTRSELWKYFLRPHKKVLNHFDKLHEWLQHKQSIQTERIGGIRRFSLYAVKKQPHLELKRDIIPCICMPPCECTWKEHYYRKPWKLNCLVKQGLAVAGDEVATTSCKCMVPCECRWTDRDVKPPWTLQGLSIKKIKKSEEQQQLILCESEKTQQQQEQSKQKVNKVNKQKSSILKNKSKKKTDTNISDPNKIEAKVLFVKVPCKCASSSYCFCLCRK